MVTAYTYIYFLKCEIDVQIFDGRSTEADSGSSIHCRIGHFNTVFNRTQKSTSYSEHKDGFLKLNSGGLNLLELPITRQWQLETGDISGQEIVAFDSQGRQSQTYVGLESNHVWLDRFDDKFGKMLDGAIIEWDVHSTQWKYNLTFEKKGCPSALNKFMLSLRTHAKR